MLDRFIHHVSVSGLLDDRKYYLLAASGGIDSMALAHLLKRTNIRFGLVHCNFQLRGEESEGDERFVRDFAESSHLDVRVKRFDVYDYKKTHGVSTQMAARALRYQWFEELLQSCGAEAMLVAHHAGDQLETILLNLLRGTGIEGVYGMADRKMRIIRPLLPFTRTEISHYVHQEGITWREDSTNETVDYKRNYIRHEILPRLGHQFNSAPEILTSSFGRIKDTGQAFFALYGEWKARHVKDEEGDQFLPVESFRDSPGRASLLFYWLRSSGFNYAQVEEIVDAVDRGVVGKMFESGDFVLNLDRDHLILGAKLIGEDEVLIESQAISADLGGVGYDIVSLRMGGLALDRSSENVMLDRDSLTFPLKVRRWKEGDRFRPLGMKKFKKISDFLIDLKVPLIHKKHVNVLCSGNDIAWVVGFRVDDRFKVGSCTENIMYIKRK